MASARLFPNGVPANFYLQAYADIPWLGMLHGEQVLWLQLDHVYSCSWFQGSPLAGAVSDSLQLATAVALPDGCTPVDRLPHPAPAQQA
ncbi:hypothetical protein [Synechococcus sp. MIT S9503]|uniref:hypothetical protein n=1 Tax=Synechococcus sp. MIT S9503 TaxID=3082547 RepID=UPI0039A4B973